MKSIQNRSIFLILTILYISMIYSSSGIIRSLLNVIKNNMGDYFPLSIHIVFILTFLSLLFIGKIRYQILLNPFQCFCLLVLILCSGIFYGYLKIPEERIHILQYGVMTILVNQCFVSKNLYKISIFSIFTVSILGVIDEWIQWLRPNRVGDIHDVGVNFMASLMTQLYIMILKPVYRNDQVD